MNATILLTGKTGQVGSSLLGLLSEIGKVVAPSREDLDLYDIDSIRRAVRDIRPQLIVNAAAYTAVDAAESDEANAYAINGAAPATLAEEARKLGAAIVHYSTDYIFDGVSRTPYEEGDLPNPINVYGKTKLFGEQAIRESGVDHLIFRTSWVYGNRGRNFLLTILRLATRKEELRIVRDQVGAPTCNWDIAFASVRILAELWKRGDGLSSMSNLTGTYHMTAAGETTWYDFAEAIIERAACGRHAAPWLLLATNGKPIMVKRIIPVTTAEYPTPASRPAYSALSNSKLIRTFGFGLPDWRTQLQQMICAEGTGGQFQEKRRDDAGTNQWRVLA